MRLGIYGTGGAGKELYEMILSSPELNARWEEIVFIDDTKEVGFFRNCRMMSFATLCNQLSNKEIEIVIGVGEPKYRSLIYKKVKQAGYCLATIIAQDAKVSNTAALGEGVVIKGSSIVSAEAKIGENTFVNSMAIIGHDVEIGNHCQVSSFSVIAGHAKVGNNVFVGVSSCIRDCVSIGDNSIVSMGAVVLKDVPEDKIAMGNPARIISENNRQSVFG